MVEKVIEELRYYTEHAYKDEDNGLVPVRVLKDALELIQCLQGKYEELKRTEHRASWKMKFFKEKKKNDELQKQTQEIFQGIDKWLDGAISYSYSRSVEGSVRCGGMNTAFHEVKDLLKKVAKEKGIEVE